MKDELFDELIESVRQGGAILRGAAQPSRSFEITTPHIKRINESYELSPGPDKYIRRRVKHDSDLESIVLGSISQ